MTARSQPPQALPVVADNVGKQYRRGWALRPTSLVIPPNRVVALVGPNGAGKSTLMGLITGLLRPTAGSIAVFGDQPTGKGLHPAVAYLAQQKPLYPQLTVAETLRFGAKTNPTWDQPYAEHLIGRANVPLQAKVGTPSGGQRTRVALALALGKRPRLLLLDEPLADLDPLARETVLQVLTTEARTQGITVVLSSHVLAELEGLCDHLVLLHRGRIVLAGDVSRLSANGTPLGELTLLGLAVVGVAVIALMRSAMLDELAAKNLTACAALALDACTAEPDVIKDFAQSWSTSFDVARIVITCGPALIGVFLGAPLFARELEQGTHVLAFTQSVSRTRWMLNKLVIALVPALIALAALQTAVWWWLEAAGTLGPKMNRPFHPMTFGIEHVSPTGYALFAFALGTFLGVVTRRTLIAMTAGLGAFVVVDGLAPARRLESPGDELLSLDSNEFLVLAQGALDGAGREIPVERAREITQACKAAGGQTATTEAEGAELQEEFLACLPESGLAKRFADVVPASEA